MHNFAMQRAISHCEYQRTGSGKEEAEKQLTLLEGLSFEPLRLKLFQAPAFYPDFLPFAHF